MSQLSDEIVESQKARTDLLKWKIIAVAVLGAGSPECRVRPRIGRTVEDYLQHFPRETGGVGLSHPQNHPSVRGLLKRLDEATLPGKEKRIGIDEPTRGIFYGS